MKRGYKDFTQADNESKDSKIRHSFNSSEDLHAFAYKVLQEVAISDHPDPAETPDWWLKLRLIECFGCQYSESVQMLEEFKALYWPFTVQSPSINHVPSQVYTPTDAGTQAESVPQQLTNPAKFSFSSFLQSEQ